MNYGGCNDCNGTCGGGVSKSKFYCGVSKLPKGKRYGSFAECAKNKQIRLYGIKRLPAEYSAKFDYVKYNDHMIKAMEDLIKDVDKSDAPAMIKKQVKAEAKKIKEKHKKVKKD